MTVVTRWSNAEQPRRPRNSVKSGDSVIGERARTLEYAYARYVSAMKANVLLSE
jgi:hypothetical protein